MGVVRIRIQRSSIAAYQEPSYKLQIRPKAPLVPDMELHQKLVKYPATSPEDCRL